MSICYQWDGTLVVTWDELRVGDIIVKCNEISWGNATVIGVGPHPRSQDGTEVYRDRPDLFGLLCDKGFASKPPSLAVYHRDQLWTIIRPSSTAPAKSSSWNSSCPKCGKGLYVGFASVEHEGGGCP